MNEAGTMGAGFQIPTNEEELKAALKAALDAGEDENAIVERFAKCSFAAANGGVEYVKRLIAEIVNRPLPTGVRKRIMDIVRGTDTDKDWRDIEKALIATKCPVFVRAGRLVSPRWRWQRNEDSDGKTYFVLSAEIEPYNLVQLTDMVAHHAVDFKVTTAPKRDRNQVIVVPAGTKFVDPPAEKINPLLWAKNWAFADLNGIVTSPAMRKDGTILEKPGFDDATGLWYKPSDKLKLNIIVYPNKDDAVAALKRLNALLDGFPFENDKDGKSVARSAALAGIMTTVVRSAIDGPVPLFVITAPDARTGKTYLVNLSGLIASGHIPVSSAGSKDAKEFEKRVETVALSGRPILHFNNLPRGMVIESDRLAELCTEGRVTIRKLGRHEEGLCDCQNMVCFLNGNNILLAADLVPRSVTCRLDAKDEHPEERKFAKPDAIADPMKEVRKDRGAVLSDVFTIVRAFKNARRDDPNLMNGKEWKKVAGFEQWSAVIQQALIWLDDLPDPMGAMEQMRAIDPTEENLTELQDVLAYLHLTDTRFSPFNAGKCKKKAEGGNDVLKAMMSERGQINTKMFGHLLLSSRDKVRNGLCIRLAKEDHKRGHWYQIEGSAQALTEAKDRHETM